VGLAVEQVPLVRQALLDFQDFRGHRELLDQLEAREPQGQLEPLEIQALQVDLDHKVHKDLQVATDYRETLEMLETMELWVYLVNQVLTVLLETMVLKDQQDQ